MTDGVIYRTLTCVLCEVGEVHLDGCDSLTSKPIVYQRKLVMLENLALSLKEFADRNYALSLCLGAVGTSGAIFLLFIGEIIWGVLILLIALPILWGFATH